MRLRSLRRAFLSVLMLSVGVVAQAQNLSKSAVLEAGQGLEMNRGDLEKMRNNSQDKKSKVVDVYLMAVSYSIVDSVMFISDIRKMDNETVNNHLFLINRQAYENQFSSFVSDGNDETMITFLYFSEKEKDILKRRSHLLKRNARTNKFEVKKIGTEFSFTSISE